MMHPTMKPMIVNLLASNQKYFVQNDHNPIQTRVLWECLHKLNSVHNQDCKNLKYYVMIQQYTKIAFV